MIKNQKRFGDHQGIDLKLGVSLSKYYSIQTYSVKCLLFLKHI